MENQSEDNERLKSWDGFSKYSTVFHRFVHKRLRQNFPKLKLTRFREDFNVAIILYLQFIIFMVSLLKFYKLFLILVPKLHQCPFFHYHPTVSFFNINYFQPRFSLISLK